MVDFEKIELMMKEVRVLLDRIRVQFPDLSFAYTGDVPIQSDEQAVLGFEMLTSVSGVLLVGLGVDYGIQIASNYHGYRLQGMDIDRAMSATYRRAGTGVVLAALTTSVAFFVLAGTGTMAFR
ncbi:MAG: MMPL family transporter [Spirochaetaceae bacterium]|nr:MMPL family transporter [Spirochaetaceae bacterium]MDT8299091.1 MMPL family transporter [Spirochaetaceae bacterium]